MPVLAVKSKTGDKLVRVDARDLKLLRRFPWRVLGNGYVASTIYMHRLIVDPAPGKVVDHINGNRMDNRRQNLRECLQRENSYNVSPRTGKRHRGVYPVGKRWGAQCMFDGKQWRLGVFGTEDEAARAYNEFAKVAFGKYARLNPVETKRGNKTKPVR